MSFAGTAGLVCLVLIAPLSRAADWNGSYSADGRCYCSGTLAPSLASRIVPTPLGGQSVAKVCARIGDGPGMSMVDGRFDRVVYADAQCGHGPFSAVAKPVDDACAGTLEPGTDDCQAKGPRWDLVAAYQSRDVRAANAVADSMTPTGVIAAPAAVPVMGAAVSSAPKQSADDVRIVEIDGRRWRLAPAGTPETGAPGSRIILDDRVYLDADRTPESVFATVTPKAPRVAAVKKARPVVKPSPKPVAPRQESAEAIRERQKTLLAEARQRLAEKKKAAPAIGAARAAADRQAAEALARKQADAIAAEKRAAARAEAEKLAAEKRVAAMEAAEKRAAAIESAERRAAELEAADKLAAEQAEAEKLAAEKLAAEKLAAEKLAAEQAETEKFAAEQAAEKAAADRLAKEQADDRRDAVDRAVETIADGDDGETIAPLIPALRMPPMTRASSREFGYVDAMPISYDYGGGGVSLEGSAVVRDSFRFVARLGAASDYQELLLGGSYYITPPRADRMTLVMTAGLETGRFELEGQGVSTELDDTGLYLGAASRFVVNQRFELQAGIGYSSFFEGDAIAFGGGFYHVAPKLDVVSRFEVGDNDSLGIGVRYYY